MNKLKNTFYSNHQTQGCFSLITLLRRDLNSRAPINEPFHLPITKGLTGRYYADRNQYDERPRAILAFFQSFFPSQRDAHKLCHGELLDDSASKFLKQSSHLLAPFLFFLSMRDGFCRFVEISSIFYCMSASLHALIYRKLISACFFHKCNIQHISNKTFAL